MYVSLVLLQISLSDKVLIANNITCLNYVTEACDANVC